MTRLLLAALLVLTLTGSARPTESQQRWYEAFAGQSEAQNQLARSFWLQQQKSNALYWWQRAAKAGSVSAVNRLLEYFPGNRQQWLKLGVEQGSALAIKQLARYQLTDAQVNWQDWQRRWWQAEYKSALQPEFGDIAALQGEPTVCTEQLTVTGASHADKARYLALLQQLKQLPLPTSQWCFNWQTQPQLSCQSADGIARAQCDVDTTGRTIILAGQGKASSSTNRITLTQSSQRKVLAHELGHWLGLADEYAMSRPLAERFCRGDYNFDARNLVITRQQIMSKAELKSLWQRLPWRDAVKDWRQLGVKRDNDSWQLGSQQQSVGLYKAATCDYLPGYYAWKPVAEITAMERHQSDHWPALYIKLINQNLMAN